MTRGSLVKISSIALLLLKRCWHAFFTSKCTKYECCTCSIITVRNPDVSSWQPNCNMAASLVKSVCSLRVSCLPYSRDMCSRLVNVFNSDKLRAKRCIGINYLHMNSSPHLTKVHFSNSEAYYSYCNDNGC